MVLMAGSFAAYQTQSSPSPAPGPDPYVQFLENWIPGIGECTELHDKLHDHFGLDFSVNSEARLLGFQLGHHPAGNFLHVVIFAVISTLLYPTPYRNDWSDLRDFFRTSVPPSRGGWAVQQVVDQDCRTAFG